MKTSRLLLLILGLSLTGCTNLPWNTQPQNTVKPLAKTFVVKHRHKRSNKTITAVSQGDIPVTNLMAEKGNTNA